MAHRYDPALGPTALHHERLLLAAHLVHLRDVARPEHDVAGGLRSGLPLHELTSSPGRKDTVTAALALPLTVLRQQCVRRLHVPP